MLQIAGGILAAIFLANLAHAAGPLVGPVVGGAFVVIVPLAAILAIPAACAGLAAGALYLVALPLRRFFFPARCLGEIAAALFLGLALFAVTAFFGLMIYLAATDPSRTPTEHIGDVAVVIGTLSLLFGAGALGNSRLFDDPKAK